MKRGKRVLEKGNIVVYLAAVIFLVLAVSIGIIMYMVSKSNTNNQGNIGKVEQNQTVEGNTESASTKIGKTVEEQEMNTVDEKTNNTIENNATANKKAENTTNSTNTNTTKKNTETNKNVNATNAQADTNKNAETETKPINETKKEITFVKPTEGEIICEFAKENLIYSETLKEWITHTAIDIKADKTSVIKAAADGIVKSIVNDPRYGLTIVMEHDDGYETVYSNLLTAEFVVEGEEVKQGQTIGTAGNTASFESNAECHLHFEILKDGEYLDPNIYLK